MTARMERFVYDDGIVRMFLLATVIWGAVGTVVGLLIAHSVVDYPLRTGAMMAVFAFACALLTEPPSMGRRAAASKAGVRGIALSFVNYLDEFPAFAAEVLPRLERLGLRVPAAAAATARSLIRGFPSVPVAAHWDGSTTRRSGREARW